MSPPGLNYQYTKEFAVFTVQAVNLDHCVALLLNVLLLFFIVFFLRRAHLIPTCVLPYGATCWKSEAIINQVIHEHHEC